MIELNIPGRGLVTLEHLVCDVNGTLALDGQLIDGVARQLNNLRDRLQIHLITADTSGRQEIIDRQLNLRSISIQPGEEGRQKAEYVARLDADQVIAIGQGANDAEMLAAAAIGVCVLSEEGTAVKTLMAAHLVVPDIFAAFELIEKPLRLVATIRK
ncbi:MAG: HAD hydrolase family protein [Anaerolineae bacterium]|nr:HAD hydrolase family protein [Anaerolineae bacterium]